MIKLAHACIEASDLEATEKFYTCLGLTRQFEFRNPAGLLIGFYLKFDNETFLEVVRVRDVKPGGGMRHFAIESDDIEAVASRLTAAGYNPSAKRLGEDNTWVVTCCDPDGQLLELHQYDKASMQHEGGVCLIDYTP